MGNVSKVFNAFDVFKIHQECNEESKEDGQNKLVQENTHIAARCRGRRFAKTSVNIQRCSGAQGHAQGAKMRK